MSGLHGNVGVWVAWVKFLRGLHGLVGSKYFLRGSAFYVGHNFYVVCVGQTCFCVGQIFCVSLCMGQNFLRGSKIFAWVNFVLRGSTFIY